MRKNILITGASSGLGLGMAEAFAAKGRNLALCARRLDLLEALRDDLLNKHPGIKVSIRALDVCDYDAVFEVFNDLDAELGGLDRIIVNAGMDSGRPLGTGKFELNRKTAETNFIGALAQCEAALALFRPRENGHLVMISSVSAYRGQPMFMNTYAATKAAVASLMEGLRIELRGTPIKVSTLFPGFIRTAINEKVKSRPFLVELDIGVAALVKAIEAEVTESSIPKWPWAAVGFALRNLPLSIVAKTFGH